MQGISCPTPTELLRSSSLEPSLPRDTHPSPSVAMQNLHSQRREARLASAQSHQCPRRGRERHRSVPTTVETGLFSRRGAADGTVRCALAPSGLPRGAPPETEPLPGLSPMPARHSQKRACDAHPQGKILVSTPYSCTVPQPQFSVTAHGLGPKSLCTSTPQRRLSQGWVTSSAGLSMASCGWPPMERDHFSISELDANWKTIKSRRKCKKKKR